MITEKHKTKILKKMCKAVKADYNSIDFKTDFYLDHEWTEKQQEKYKKWLTKFLMRKYKMIKIIAEREAEGFIMFCGWKIKED